MLTVDRGVLQQLYLRTPYVPVVRSVVVRRFLAEMTTWRRYLSPVNGATFFTNCIHRSFIGLSPCKATITTCTTTVQAGFIPKCGGVNPILYSVPQISDVHDDAA
jgi:hypothetical protein